MTEYNWNEPQVYSRLLGPLGHSSTVHERRKRVKLTVRYGPGPTPTPTPTLPSSFCLSSNVFASNVFASSSRRLR